jgi:hypothetical protein
MESTNPPDFPLMAGINGCIPFSPLNAARPVCAGQHRNAAKLPTIASLVIDPPDPAISESMIGGLPKMTGLAARVALSASAKSSPPRDKWAMHPSMLRSSRAANSLRG